MAVPSDRVRYRSTSDFHLVRLNVPSAFLTRAMPASITISRTWLLPAWLSRVDSSDGVALYTELLQFEAVAGARARPKGSELGAAGGGGGFSVGGGGGSEGGGGSSVRDPSLQLTVARFCAFCRSLSIAAPIPEPA